MGWLSRRAERPRRDQFTVGVASQRVVLHGGTAGITMLAELHGYVASVTGHSAEPIDGRDSVAVLSAKLDQAELVEDVAVAVGLAFEELVERGVLDAGEVPARPALPPLAARATHYDYIQSTAARTAVRLTWLDAADAVLRAHDVAVLPPAPPEESRERPR